MIRLWKVPSIIFFVLVIIFSSCGCFRREVEEVVAGVEREDKPLYQDIPVDEAKRLIDINDNVFIIDVRTQQEYDEGHILGFKLIPIDEFEKAVSEGKIPPGKTVLIHCRSGNRSSRAADILSKTGYNYVQAYNCQVAVDGYTHVIVVADVSYDANDKLQLKPMAEMIETNCRRLPEVLTADNGYYSSSNVEHLRS